LLTRYYSRDQIEKHEIGGAGNFERGEERCVQGYGGETRRKKATWEDLGVDGEIMKLTLINRMERGVGGTELIWLR
jgi:hypothetical protein